MTIRADSYSSTGEVVAFVPYLLEGGSSFNSTTRPTVTQVEKYIDRASGVLNTVLRGHGLSVPITNSTAKLTCDDWVTARVAEYAELSQRGTGYSEQEGNRAFAFRSLWKSAEEFAKQMVPGLILMGVTVSNYASDGLQFTGMDAQNQRDDPTDTTLEQPKFRRALFDDSSAEED